MTISRLLGLIGSAGCLGFVVFFLYEKGFPNNIFDFLLFCTLLLSGFNLMPPYTDKETLLGLWIEAKKAKLRKEIE